MGSFAQVGTGLGTSAASLARQRILGNSAVCISPITSLRPLRILSVLCGLRSFTAKLAKKTREVRKGEGSRDSEAAPLPDFVILTLSAAKAEESAVCRGSRRSRFLVAGGSSE